MHLIKYEDFVHNKYASIKNIANELNLKSINDISEILDKQYQPKGKKRDIAVKDFFGEENLSRITNICKENMQKLGYSN